MPTIVTTIAPEKGAKIEVDRTSEGSTSEVKSAENGKISVEPKERSSSESSKRKSDGSADIGPEVKKQDSRAGRKEADDVPNTTAGTEPFRTAFNPGLLSPATARHFQNAPVPIMPRPDGAEGSLPFVPAAFQSPQQGMPYPMQYGQHPSMGMPIYPPPYGMQGYFQAHGASGTMAPPFTPFFPQPHTASSPPPLSAHAAFIAPTPAQPDKAANDKDSPSNVAKQTPRGNTKRTLAAAAKKKAKADAAAAKAELKRLAKESKAASQLLRVRKNERVEECPPGDESKKKDSKGGQEMWQAMFYQLVLFKGRHGDLNVKFNSNENKNLYYWIQNQRQHYKAYKEGRPTYLTSDRILALSTIDFQFNIRGETYWNKYYEMLKEFKEEHGHCIVQRTTLPCPKLYEFVADQRKQYKLKNVDKKKTQLSDEREEMLTALGFVWKVRDKTAWDERYDELLKYKEEKGDCMVPQHFPINRQLGKWVAKQREQYRHLVMGKHSNLSKDRIDKLLHAGFAWTVKGRSHRKLQEEMKVGEFADDQHQDTANNNDDDPNLQEGFEEEEDDGSMESEGHDGVGNGDIYDEQENDYDESDEESDNGEYDQSASESASDREQLESNDIGLQQSHAV